jgi:CheY-like chemotaxis protein
VNTQQSNRSQVAQPHSATRILIADDRPSSRELLRVILEGSGYEVAEAEDGEQVLERSASFKPHLIALDLQMPKLDGYAAAMALRKISAFEKTPIVALTAAASDVLPKQLSQAGFTGYMVKPIAPARLRQCIASLLARRTNDSTN